MQMIDLARSLKLQKEKTILKILGLKVKRRIPSLKQQAMNLLNRVSDQKKHLTKAIELELELAESQLASRMSRKKEYKQKLIEITQANERKWLLK